MNILTKALCSAAAVALFAAAPALASADRIYYLVGMRHVYRIGPDKYFHVSEREKIEKDYADQVAADNDMYNKAVAGGSDPKKESHDLNAALNDLAAQRESELAALYPVADYERARHREFRIQADGPYQVIGVDVHLVSNVEVIDDYEVYRPWPGYVVTDPPYGWSYGVVYNPGVFLNLYTGWYGLYVGWGSPAFVGFYGNFGPLIIGGFFRTGGVVAWRGGYGHGIYGGGAFGVGRVSGHFGTAFRGGAAVGRYNAGMRGTGGSFAARRSGATVGRYGSSFRSSTAGRATSGFGRSTAGRTGSTSGRYRSSFGGGRTSGHTGTGGSRYTGHSSSSFGGGRSSGFGGGRSSGGFGGGRSSGHTSSGGRRHGG